MVEKRYQWLSNTGIRWTKWFPFKKGNSTKGLEKWQVRNKLLNEYRIVKD